MELQAWHPKEQTVTVENRDQPAESLCYTHLGLAGVGGLALSSLAGATSVDNDSRALCWGVWLLVFAGGDTA
jgi:hypothetical protein